MFALLIRGARGGGGEATHTPTDAVAPGRSHQPCGGYRGTPSPSHAGMVGERSGGSSGLPTALLARLSSWPFVDSIAFSSTAVRSCS